MNNNLKKGGIALADQILFSGSNFLLNLFLVKLLTPADYGLFGSLYSLYLLICIAFIAIFLEPYIFYKNTLGGTERYTTLHAGFANALLVSALLFTGIGYLTRGYLFVYLSYTLSTCVIYFYKRHFLSILTPTYSLYISVGYFVLVSAGLLVLNYVIAQTLFNAFLVLNMASVFSIIPMLFLKPQFMNILYRFQGWRDFLVIIKRQKKYSFHCLISGLLSWVPNNVYFIVLPLFYSNEINAQFKALQNISLPITHLNIAIVSLLVPMFMKSVNVGKLIKDVSALFIAVPLVYLLAILLMSDSIEQYIYDSKYELRPVYVIALLLGIIPEIIANIYKAFFRSIERPELVTKVNLINALLALACVYWVYRFGLVGVIGSYVIVNLFNLSSSLYFFMIEARHQRQKQYEMA